nr:hypothetical protein [Tanacetum cinerariifolium]
GHTPPNTIDADSSTPQRFVHPPLARAPRCTEAYLRWRSAPLSTMYPLTRSKSSAGDSSSGSSVGPSHKRCRSPAATRFRDFISPEDSVEEDIDTDVLEDIEADATAVEVVVDRDVEAGIDASIGTMEVGVDMDVGTDIPDGMLMPDAIECLEQVEDERVSLSYRTRSLEQKNLKVQALLCIKRYRVDSLLRHMALSREDFCQVHRDLDDTPMRLNSMNPKSIEELVNRCVEEALAAYEVTRAANALKAENRSQNGSDGNNGNSGNGNGGNGGNGNGE